jgi:site-specific DNA-methyltransferase (adenine-specific)
MKINDSIEIYHGDCLEVMKSISDNSIDMILCDLPYGTTACKWDTIINFKLLWKQYERIIKENGAIILFAIQPFTSLLVVSNINLFRYTWVWDKEYGTDFQLAKLRPMRSAEDICVFSKAKTANGAKTNMKYYPQKSKLEKPVKNGGAPTTKLLHENSMKKLDVLYTAKSPLNVLHYKPVFNTKNHPRLHPTQKPIDLLEYLVKTYTNENEIVLDNCMGSGSTGVACINTNRKFIGIELDEKYYKIAEERLLNTLNGNTKLTKELK